jgi:hypothetical protein
MLHAGGGQTLNHSGCHVIIDSKEMAEFDAVYPFHGTDTWELEQSIRLLRKFTRVRNIYIIGDSPNIPETIHVPFIQEDAKEINIWKKTLAACLIADVSEDFLFMNDDHFIMREMIEIPNYYSGD